MGCSKPQGLPPPVIPAEDTPHCRTLPPAQATPADTHGGLFRQCSFSGRFSPTHATLTAPTLGTAPTPTPPWFVIAESFAKKGVTLSGLVGGGWHMCPCSPQAERPASTGRQDVPGFGRGRGGSAVD